MSLFSDAREVIAGGVNSPVRAFAGVGGEPVFFASAKGYTEEVLENCKQEFETAKAKGSLPSPKFTQDSRS